MQDIDNERPGDGAEERNVLGALSRGLALGVLVAVEEELFSRLGPGIGIGTGKELGPGPIEGDGALDRDARGRRVIRFFSGLGRSEEGDGAFDCSSLCC